jgi:phosphoribosylanthranilate isomerase
MIDGGAEGGAAAPAVTPGVVVPAVKVCGVCREMDAAAAVAAGASYIGVILSPGHGRTRTVAEAAAIFGACGGAQRVGVFVDEEPGVVLRAAERLRLDVVQLHGAEDEATVAAIAAPRSVQVWKAVRVRAAADVLDGVARHGHQVNGLLLDGWSAGHAGGSGAAFDRETVAAVRGRLPAGVTFIAAGGLTPENVSGLVTLLQPDVVDVSSGVEEALCRKSAARVRAFVEAAQRGGAPGSG